jgi:hypothetical protein
VHIDRKDNGTIVLTQKGLTDRVIEALGVGSKPIKQTPAEYGCLGSDKTGEFARYTHAPRRSHEKALERIGQYLKGTRDKGLILNANGNGNLKIEAYVDADFAGMWGHEDAQDPTSVKSRTGFVIFISNCPVVWSSKLQTDIATSTMEAEYNALSLAMREVIPLKQLTREICNSINMEEQGPATLKTTVYEDNSGALTLARLEPGRMTPRSKHYGVKYHWFRSKLQPNEIELEKVESLLQRADILTKALRTEPFKSNRKLTCGW